MANVDTIRNGIIDKLLSISNKEYLNALYHLIENCSTDQNKIKLTKEQIFMLQLSDIGIKNDKLISQSQLDKNDLRWLKDM